MKAYKILILILVLVTVSQAAPRRHSSNRHFRHTRVVRLHAGFYSPAYGPWIGSPWIGSYRYYSGWYNPVVYAQADSVKLIYMDAETMGVQITRLDEIRKQGLISDKEFKRLKKRLLSQVGMIVPVRQGAIDLGQVLNELESLHRLVKEGVLTDKEYASQKRRMLAHL